MTESAAFLALKAEVCPGLLKDIYPEQSRGASPLSAPAARDQPNLRADQPYRFMTVFADK
jgi:hypothetical protein